MSVCAAVERPRKGSGKEKHFVLVVRCDLRARVVVRAPAELAVGVDHLPVLAAVVGTPQLAELPGAVRLRDAVTGFNLRVHAVGIFLGHAHGNSAHGRMRQAMTFQALPGDATVCRPEQAAAGPAAGAAPGVNLDLPHAGKKDSRIVGIHSHVRAARVFVDEKHFVPRFSAVAAAEDAALWLRSVGVAQRAREHDVWIARVDLHAADTACLLQSHQRPGLAGVHGFVNTLSHGDVAADERFAGPRPHDIRIARRYCQRTDGRHRFRVENGVPVDPAIGAFENASGGRAHIPDVWSSRHSGDRCGAVAFGADVPILELAVHVRTDGWLLRLQQKGATSSTATAIATTYIATTYLARFNMVSLSDRNEIGMRG